MLQTAIPHYAYVVSNLTLIWHNSLVSEREVWEKMPVPPPPPPPPPPTFASVSYSTMVNQFTHLHTPSHFSSSGNTTSINHRVHPRAHTKQNVLLLYCDVLWLKSALQSHLVVRMVIAIMNHGLTTSVLRMTTGEHRETVTEQVWAAREKRVAIRHS